MPEGRCCSCSDPGVIFKILPLSDRALGLNTCMQDTFARATHSAARPSARATIGYLVYNLNTVKPSACDDKVSCIPYLWLKPLLLVLLSDFACILRYKTKHARVGYNPTTGANSLNHYTCTNVLICLIDVGVQCSSS